MYQKYISFLLLVLLVSCQTIQTKPATEENINSSIPFQLTEHNNISIKSTLNGKDSLNLMFHTAASSLTITTAASENLQSIKWDTEENVNSWGGEASAKFSENNSLNISDLVWDSLAVWQTQNSGPGTDGKFGPKLFIDKVIKIDFNSNTITVSDNMPVDIKDFTKVPIFFENEFMFIEASSRINNINYLNKFLIHSGYGGTILFDDKFVAESNIGEHIEIIDEQELKDSYGNVIKTKKGKLPLFTFGSHEFNNIPVGFFEGSIGRQQMSVIGGDLIKRFNIIIDSERKYIYLQENKLTEIGYTEF